MRYFYVKDIEKMMNDFNKTHSSDKELKFKVMKDYALVNERLKTVRNVIVGKNCRFIATTNDKRYWNFEVNGNVIYRGTLAECIERYDKLE